MQRLPFALVLLTLASMPSQQVLGQRPPDTVFLEELTWTEVRDLQRAGRTTILIGTAGQEQKGPHMVTGEHHFVLEHTSEDIARALGNALVAPIITYVPEGSWEATLGGDTATGGWMPRALAASWPPTRPSRRSSWASCGPSRSC